jgi:hypothetical protein
MGMLFKEEMLTAIRQHRKTNTRRLGGLWVINNSPDKYKDPTPMPDGRWCFHYGEHLEMAQYAKPRYKPHTIQYLSETWATSKEYDNVSPIKLSQYVPIWYKNGDVEVAPLAFTGERGRWRSPMFLRECHARAYVGIKNVVPQRLMDISEIDAIKEGCPQECMSAPIDWFMKLWDSINPELTRDKNPWVWRYELQP